MLSEKLYGYGEVRFDSQLTMQAPLIVSRNRCAVSLKHTVEKIPEMPFGLTEAKEPSNFCFTYYRHH